MAKSQLLVVVCLCTIGVLHACETLRAVLHLVNKKARGGWPRATHDDWQRAPCGMVESSLCVKLGNENILYRVPEGFLIRHRPYAYYEANVNPACSCTQSQILLKKPKYCFRDVHLQTLDNIKMIANRLPQNFDNLRDSQYCFCTAFAIAHKQ